MASVSAPASCPVWVPVLTSFGDELQCECVSWRNPFLPNLLLGHDVCVGIETLTKTAPQVSFKINTQPGNQLTDSPSLEPTPHRLERMIWLWVRHSDSGDSVFSCIISEIPATMRLYGQPCYKFILLAGSQESTDTKPNEKESSESYLLVHGTT